MNLQDPRFYDCPRKLAPPSGKKNEVSTTEKNSPLQSPTDSDSVFNDDDWVNNSSSEISKFFLILAIGLDFYKI